MALNSNALTTLAEAKSFMDIPTLETGEDSRLEMFINTASAMIENYTSRKLKSQSITEYHDGRSSNKIQLMEYPASKPSVLNVDSNWVFASGDNYATDTYDIHEESIVVLKGGVFPKGRRNIKVTYTAGYSTIPSDLENACLMLVEYMYQRRNDRRTGRTTQSKNGENISYKDSIPEFIEQMLEPYVRLEFPTASVGVENV